MDVDYLETLIREVDDYTVEFSGKTFAIAREVLELGFCELPPTPIMLVAGVYGGLIAVVGKAVGTIVFDDESRDYDLEIDDEYNEFVNWRLNYLCNLIGVKSHRDRFAVLNYLITGNFDQLWIE